MTTDQLTTHLQSYNWKPLWHAASSYKNDLDLPRDNTLDTLYIFLLAVWWQDYLEAKTLLSTLNIKQHNSYSYLFTIVSYMAIGDTKKVEELRKLNIDSMPKWMKHWIEIEYLGRSGQTKKQIQFVEKIININASDRKSVV